MILLVDLDGTLVDRDTAFTTWAGLFLADIAAPPDDEQHLAWLLAADDDGYTPRAALAGALKDRFDLAASVPELVERLLFEHVQHIRAYVGVLASLRALTAAGAVVVVVTNGTTAQQTLKLQVTGLADLVHDAVVSEAVGVRKPDPSIFRAALDAAAGHGGGGPAWMVGDHPVADIAGARACGLQTGWVSHHRPWRSGFPPDITASATADVLAGVGRALTR